VHDLAGRVAVITGGASGVGRALAARLARERMRVVLADVEKPALERTVEELRAQGLTVEGVVTDVSEFASVEALAHRVFDAHGNVHLLFNNAGVGLGEARVQMWSLPLEDWRWGLGVNLWGVIHGIRAFVPGMLERGEEGWVVNTSSGNGGLTVLPDTPVYTASKAAVTAISETLHYQFLRTGAKLRAGVLFPGPHLVNTKLLGAARNRPADLTAPDSPQARFASMAELAKAAGRPLELTEPEEVAELALEGIRAGRFWILPDSPEQDARVRERLEGILARRNPLLPV
jgi:NAD(P)-dependent dehydrogenase (short-subunit alcohol dehydrogenase family)